MYYVLNGKEVVAIDSITEWGKWFGTADRTVAKTEVKHGVEVSTVFLGLDHSFHGKIPLVFETMVFGGENDGEMERYSTWDEAEAGHKKMVESLGAAER